LKKKSAGDRKKLVFDRRKKLVFRVFEQKKRRVPVFEPPIWQHTTPAHVDTHAHDKRKKRTTITTTTSTTTTRNNNNEKSKSE
jgi:hypothetical protein